MNVNDMTFGVEIETTIPSGQILVGPHGAGSDIPQLTGWKADRDPSIRVRTRGHVACEFVSPVFQGVDGLRKLLADLVIIKRMGARVNASCGLHIHVGFDKQNPEAMARLMTLVANFEKAIFASTGTKYRERGRWCGGIQRYQTLQNAQTNAPRSRYHVLNVATGDKPTVEFRAFGATLNGTKLAGYVRMVLAIVERALTAKRTTEWTAKTPVETSPISRGGEGQTAVNRLFYQLGWTKGRQDHVHGDLSGTGLPSIKRTKKELMRLAKKYDSQA